MGEEQLLAYYFNSIRRDCGSKLGYLRAQAAFGLKIPEVRDGLVSTVVEAGRDAYQG